MHIYSSTNLQDLAIEIGEKFKEFLDNGSPETNLPGLRTPNGPLFVLVQGTEEPPIILNDEDGDETAAEDHDRTIMVRPRVYFRDDISQVNVPYVKIISIIPDGNLWDYDYYTNISQWIVVLDIVCNESTGDVTPGESPSAASYVLASSVYQMINHYKSMVNFGFCNSSCKSGAPSGIELITKFPITVNCEIYSYKDGFTVEVSSSESSDSYISSESSNSSF